MLQHSISRLILKIAQTVLDTLSYGDRCAWVGLVFTTIFNYAQKSHVHFLNDIFSHMQTVAGPKCLSIYVVQSGCRDQNLPSNRIQMTQTS